MVVKRTELLEAEPLTPLKPPRPRLIWTFVVVVVASVIGLLGGDTTMSLGLFLLGLWLVFAGYTWFHSRSFIQAKGPVFKVRSLTRMHEVRAADVVGLRHQFNGRRPDFQLLTKQGKAIWVPTSKFAGGQATLFAWLGWFVPEAKLDKKSQLYRGFLVEDDLI